MTQQQTVQANMKVKSFVSPTNPTDKQLIDFEKEVNTFLQSVDNQDRFLSGRNSYALGNRIYILIWYLDRIEDKPITTPFGGKGKDNKDGNKGNLKEAGK